jgi:arsenate reductase (glutaredoxin)
MHNPAIVVYGIKNCDSVKRARNWLDSRQINYRFHDYRTDGLDAGLLQDFIDKLGLDSVLNQRSSSWRLLDEEQKRDVTIEKAMQLMLATPALIKRPIIAIDTKLIVGFNPDQLSTLL